MSTEEERTETDKRFEADRPGYYIFEKLRERVHCMTCGKRFDTHLLFTNFCSPRCKDTALNKKTHKHATTKTD